MRKLLKKINKDTEFLSIVSDITSHKDVQRMSNYKQHYNTSCFNHCLFTAYYCYVICKRYNLDYVSCARAAMLHDLFLYDWKNRKKEPDYKMFHHAFTHPKSAYKNASYLFDLNDKETDIILKHMWPVTIKFPKYTESLIVTFVDKYCALLEWFEHCSNTLYSKKLYKHAYVFLSLILFRAV